MFCAELGVYITGWGATSFRGPTSNILLQGLIQVTPPDECKNKFAQFKNGENILFKRLFISI